MAKGIKRQIDKVHKVVKAKIAAFASRDSIYAGGLASEGYNGGYRDALSDVTLALNGARPHRWAKWGIYEEEE